MEGGGSGSGKREEEAGPSSTRRVAGEEKKLLGDILNGKAEDGEAFVGESDDDDGEHHRSDHDDETNSRGVISSFVPGPLLSLKDQIEKDKVFFYSSLLFAVIL